MFPDSQKTFSPINGGAAGPELGGGTGAVAAGGSVVVLGKSSLPGSPGMVGNVAALAQQVLDFAASVVRYTAVKKVRDTRGTIFLCLRFMYILKEFTGKLLLLCVSYSPFSFHLCLASSLSSSDVELSSTLQ